MKLKLIKGYENIYVISSKGEIYSLPRKNGVGSRLVFKIRKPRLNKGYLEIGLSKNAKVIWFKVHRLVAITFIPNPNKLPHINHKNGIKVDNRVKNLEWCTNSHNNTHARKLGLMGGEKGNTSKLTEKQVKEIRRLYPNLSSLQLAKKYNVVKSTISKIIRKETWKWI